jgi:hypothetical protein
MMGNALSTTGDLVPARENYDKGLAVYSPSEHRALATRFGQDMRVGILIQRSLTMWMLGYPGAAQTDVNQALAEAREIGQAGTLMVALCITSLTRILCGDFSAAEAQSDEVIPVAKEKVSPIWEAFGRMNKGCVLHAYDRDREAIETTTAGMAVYQASRAAIYIPYFLVPDKGRVWITTP